MRERADREYVKQFAGEIRSQYPGCPVAEAQSIAEHACLKYSGRVGRSSAAKEFDGKAIELAVRAHVRHAHTPYDRLLSQGWDRHDARSAVADGLDRIVSGWSR